MRSEWNTYRTRFLVRARQLTEPVYFLDALGREQNGQPGDYLVESSYGLRSIIPRQPFEDIYVAMTSTTATDSLNSDDSRRQTQSVRMDDRLARSIAV